MGWGPRTQARIMTRMEALKADFVKGGIEVETLEIAAERLLRTGLADQPCPFHPRHGLGWWHELTPQQRAMFPAPRMDRLPG